MFKRPSYIALGLVLVLVIILLNLPSRVTTQLKLAIGTVFFPLFGTSTATQTVGARTANAVVPRKVLKQQLEELQVENQHLKLRLMQTEPVLRENDQLRNQLDWDRQARWNMKLARVIGRDPANWYRVIHIDLGSRDGVLFNMPVLVQNGLVGRVGSVGYTRSMVVLVGDPKCHVSVSVLAANGRDIVDMGIVSPSSKSTLDTGLVDLAYLTNVDRIRPGQQVITSGLGGIFPMGIPVGTIVHSQPVHLGLQADARVKLSVPLYKLEEVWVMFP